MFLGSQHRGGDHKSLTCKFCFGFCVNFRTPEARRVKREELMWRGRCVPFENFDETVTAAWKILLSPPFFVFAFQHNLASAVFSRIRFCRLFFTTLITFSKEKVPVEIYSLQHFEIELILSVWNFFQVTFCTTRCFLETLQGLSVVDVQKLLRQMSDLIQTMQTTLSLGVKPPEAEEGSSGEIITTSSHIFVVNDTMLLFFRKSNYFCTADYPTIMGFETLVNQRLLPPTFPRYTKINTREETMEYLLGLVDRLKSVCGITEISNLHTALVSCAAHCLL